MNNTGDLSRNFSRHEFTCRCGCGFDTVDADLLHLLQVEIRDYYNRPVTILSGCRCFQHNLNTPGAARDSMHMEAKAADIRVCSVSPRALYHYLDRKYKKKYGLGLYRDRIHVDVRPVRARWKKC